MRTVFFGGQMFDAIGGAMTRADIVIEGPRIVEVGSALTGDVAIDASGLTVLPGLFDCHVHVLLNGIDFMQAMYTPFSYRFFQAARNLESTLAAGITTVRDASGADLGLKQAVDDGLVNGPRLQISIRLISQTGGASDDWLPYGGYADWFFLPPYPGSPAAVVDGPQEIRKKVRELVRDGADVIKVASSGAVLATGDDPRRAHFSLDELRALVDEASAARCPVMAHAISNEGIKNAVRAGVRSIEHGTFLDDEAIELMLERGTYLVPTLMADPGVVEAAEERALIPADRVELAKEVIAAGQASFRKAVAAGVKIAMGSDTGVTPHGANLTELTIMSEMGMKPVEVLRAATIGAAECTGLDDLLGSVSTGKLADLVLVHGDPFDFSTLRERVRAVYKDGRCVYETEPAAPR